MSNAVNEFSRFAHQYNQYNIIQTQVAQRLIKDLPDTKYAMIIDVGCGSGAVHTNIKHNRINYKKFIALDSADEMLKLHPNGEKIEKIQADFNKNDMYEKLKPYREKATLISASALQWSENLDFVFSHLSYLAHEAHFAIFTSGTFSTLHSIANIKSPIYTKEEIQDSIKRYYKANFRVQSYELQFKTAREMFSYIKKSGVSGGKKQLSYTQMKHLMQRYPLDYLEFEVLFVEATSLAI